jgi:hypothetical protein
VLPRSSPPRRKIALALAVDEETVPVRIPRNTGRAKPLMLESDEDDDNDLPVLTRTYRKSTSTGSSPVPAHMSSTDRDEDDVPAESQPSSPMPQKVRRTTRRLPSTGPDNEAEEDVRPDRLQDFVASLIAENELEEVKRKKEKTEAKDSQASTEPVGLFDDDSDEMNTPKEGKGKKGGRVIRVCWPQGERQNDQAYLNRT